MKVRILGVLVLTALIVAVAFSVSMPATSKAALPTPAATAIPANAMPDHPEIHEAIASLRHAKEHLEHAAHDFGGHRVEAIRATDEAIHQLEICLKYDK